MDTVYENREKFKESIRSDKVIQDDVPAVDGVISSSSTDSVSDVVAFILRLIDDALVPVYDSYQSRTKKAKQLWGLVKTSARPTSLSDIKF